MTDEDIEKIMNAEIDIPKPCDKAVDDALAKIKTEKTKADALGFRHKAKLTGRIPTAGIAAALVAVVICAGGILMQQNNNGATTSEQIAQQVIDYRDLCQSKLDELKSIARSQGTGSSQSSAVADSVETEDNDLDKLIVDYEKQLSELSDESSLRHLYEQICTSVEDNN